MARKNEKLKSELETAEETTARVEGVLGGDETGQRIGRGTAEKRSGSGNRENPKLIWQCRGEKPDQ